MEKQMVSIEIDTTLAELMELVGCSSSLIAAAIQHNLKAEYSLSGVTVFGSDSEAITTADTAPIKLGALQGIITGKLTGGAVIPMARAALEKSVKVVLTNCGWTPDSHFQKKAIDIGPYNEPYLNPIDVDPFEANKTLADVLKPVKVESVVSTVPSAVPTLANATELYQPVKGTDPHSVYYLVATGPFNVAARMKNGKLSIRCEGDPNELSLHSVDLKKVGMKKSDTGHYSVHLDISDDKPLARRALGAVLYGINAQFDKIAIDANKLWDKGN